MKKQKKTINRSIFISHIAIITLCLLVTAIVFNIAINLYFRKQSRTQLIKASVILKKSLETELLPLDKLLDSSTPSKETAKLLLKINKSLKQTKLFLDIDYAFVGNKNNIFFPNNIDDADISLLEDKIHAMLKNSKVMDNTLKKNNIKSFTLEGKNYISILYPVKLKDNNLSYLFLYSDISKNKELTMVINIILFSILILAAITALIASRVISRKISTPISKLSIYAKEIGKRNYSVPMENFSDDEINELYRNMDNMAKNLASYDNTLKTFMQNASHELRTPLMSIQGYAEGIKYGVMEDSSKAVDVIIEESKRLSTIVEDLLFLSKIDSLQDKLNLEVINGEELLRSCIERVSGIGVNKNINISLNTEDINLSFMGDDEKLSRCIINILGNCLRYGKKHINLTLRKENNNALILIKDDGLGFEEQDLDKVFERFFKGKNGNHGLGLSICKTIVELHGGNITAGNNEEGGAFFKIVLPIK